MRKIRKVLIANRGEIALRVARACAEVGIESVAVFSDADRTSLHVRAADEAYPIGPPPSTESYLRIDKLLDVAQRCGADAVHPGYGFLAENAGFAEAVEEAGLVWIGPPPAAMRRLGDKLQARRLVAEAGLPTVPGTDVQIDDLEQASAAADRIGYPILIKASGGGGGKGMRLVKRKGELEAALRTARSEAQSSFGSDVVYLEKYLEPVRHVEIQVLGDHHGNIVHLGERECSIQRRHQKLIEEAPSVVVDDDLRARMGAVAVQAARAAGYASAGTVEFLVDRRRNFYFLEVNTRLQVEHPVTEMVSGVDLVLEQFRVASGRPLRIKQADVAFSGHAIECRIAAEDTFNNFAPSLGTITGVAEPGGPGVRVDSSIYRGGSVSVYYDPMIAKLIVWAPTRAHAILRMRRALGEYRISGVHTNIPFHMAVMDSIDFQRGRLDTRFVERLLESREALLGSGEQELLQVAALAGTLVTDSLVQTGAGVFRQARDGTGAYGEHDGNRQRASQEESSWRQAARRGALR